MTLPADISRCQGATSIGAMRLVCRKRSECERFLTLLTERDMQTPVSAMLCVSKVLAVAMTDPRYPYFIPADEGAE